MKRLVPIKRYTALAYFLSTFIISWGGVLILTVPGGIPGTAEQTEELFPIALMIQLIGPILSGLVLTGIVYGKAGFKEVYSRLTKWRIGIRWTVFVFLFTPLLVLGILLILSIFSSEFLPNIITTKGKGSLLLTGLMTGIMGGFFEEIGWTGFVIPELRRRYGVLSTGIIVGGLWGAWHLLITIWASGNDLGALSISLFLPPLIFYIVVLPVYRILMVWIYDHTQSLLAAMLMHASLIFSTLFVLQPKAVNENLIIYYFILSLLLGSFYAIVNITAKKKNSSR